MSTSHPDDTRSDETLLCAMALGDRDGGVAFVRRYQRRVFGLALSVLGDPQAAEDVAQEALIRVWKHAAVYDTRRSSVATWVLTITRNLAIDALRLRRSVPIDPGELVAMGLDVSHADPAEHAERSDLSSAVRSALSDLPVGQRRALVLSAFYGLTAMEIAEMESIPLGTAKTRIRAGLAKVREVLGVVPVATERSGAGERPGPGAGEGPGSGAGGRPAGLGAGERPGPGAGERPRPGELEGAGGFKEMRP